MKKKSGENSGVQTFVKVLNGWAYKIVKICALLVVKSGMHVPNSLHFLTFRQLPAAVVSLPYVRLLKFLCQNILRERGECRKRSKNEARANQVINSSFVLFKVQSGRQLTGNLFLREREQKSILNEPYNANILI